MRHYETVIVPEKQEKKLVKTTCDLCGEVEGKGKWRSSSYDVDETEIEITVRQRDGYSYPEGGAGTEFSVDMCPNCFKTKLIPWLQSQGCSAERTDWDW